MEGKGRRPPLRSSDRVGDGVVGLQGKEDGANRRNGRERVRVTVRVK